MMNFSGGICHSKESHRAISNLLWWQSLFLMNVRLSTQSTQFFAMLLCLTCLYKSHKTNLIFMHPYVLLRITCNDYARWLQWAEQKIQKRYWIRLWMKCKMTWSKCDKALPRSDSAEQNPCIMKITSLCLVRCSLDIHIGWGAGTFYRLLLESVRRFECLELISLGRWIPLPS